jgi:hypothetical protein
MTMPIYRKTNWQVPYKKSGGRYLERLSRRVQQRLFYLIGLRAERRAVIVAAQP